MGIWCNWPRPQAESVVSTFVGDKSDEPHGQSARRFCQKEGVGQTRRGAGFPDPMGTWRPQAESVLTQIC